MHVIAHGVLEQVKRERCFQIPEISPYRWWRCGEGEDSLAFPLWVQSGSRAEDTLSGCTKILMSPVLLLCRIALVRCKPYVQRRLFCEGSTAKNKPHWDS